MFWSHEILASNEHGVATIWLVATMGPKSLTRKVNRKSIQAVDVAKACETILDPGAPIALRLQGNLLYGVSKVFLHQCTYMLSDAEKIQTNMRDFFSNVVHSELLLDEGEVTKKSKRHQLVIMDDPAFDLNFDIPAFDFDQNGGLAASQLSQRSAKTTSQLSPLDRELSISSDGLILGGLDIPRSSSSGRLSNQMPMPFTLGSMDSQKHGEEFMPFGATQEDGPLFEDTGVIIDEDFNVRPVRENELDLELPVLSAPDAIGQDDGAFLPPMSDPFQSSDQEPKKKTAGISGASASQDQQPDQQEHDEEGMMQLDGVQETQAPARRARRPLIIKPDASAQLPKSMLKYWADNYVELRQKERKQQLSRKLQRSRKEESKSLWMRTIGCGPIDIDEFNSLTSIPGYVHPLIEQFTGDAVKKLLGFHVKEEQEQERGRRRSADDAGLGGEDEDRRVRPRLEDQDDQAGQLMGEDDLLLPPLGEAAAEVGRDGAPALPDLPSDLPWNRRSSMLQGSSAIKGSAQRRDQAGRQVSASPLQRRGSILQEVERFSDQPGFPSDNFGAGGLDFSSPDGALPFNNGSNGSGGQKLNTSQATYKALDREGHNFLNYLETVATDKGKQLDADADDYRWIALDDLFDPMDSTRHNMVQAFYHVLCLSTKALVKVKQEHQGIVLSGTIQIGVKVLEQGPDVMEGVERSIHGGSNDETTSNNSAGQDFEEGAEEIDKEGNEESGEESDEEADA